MVLLQLLGPRRGDVRGHSHALAFSGLYIWYELLFTGKRDEVMREQRSLYRITLVYSSVVCSTIPSVRKNSKS